MKNIKNFKISIGNYMNMEQFEPIENLVSIGFPSD